MKTTPCNSLGNLLLVATHWQEAVMSCWTQPALPWVQSRWVSRVKQVRGAGASPGSWWTRAPIDRGLVESKLFHNSPAVSISIAVSQTIQRRSAVVLSENFSPGGMTQAKEPGKTAVFKNVVEISDLCTLGLQLHTHTLHPDHYPQGNVRWNLLTDNHLEKLLLMRYN